MKYGHIIPRADLQPMFIRRYGFVSGSLERALDYVPEDDDDRLFVQTVYMCGDASEMIERGIARSGFELLKAQDKELSSANAASWEGALNDLIELGVPHQLFPYAPVGVPTRE